MSRTNTYQHFCPVARSLEIVGEKWSLLIVRELLRGRARFTDLAANLSNITPKWLTLRLRDLELAGIVNRQSEEGRREVWYSLTQAGRDLGPVIEALNVWGIRHELRPPQPGETTSIRAMVRSLGGFLNSSAVRPDHPCTWVFENSENGRRSLIFTGQRWRLGEGTEPDPDLVIRTDRFALARFLAAPEGARGEALQELELEGDPAEIAGFRAACSV